MTPLIKQQQQKKRKRQPQREPPLPQKRIIIKRNAAASEQRPSIIIIQTILRFVTFLPLTILFLERLWIPLSGYYDHYYDLSNEASTTTFKSNKTQLTSRNSSSGLAALVAAEYPLERSMIQQEQPRQHQQQQQSITAIWSSSFGMLFGRTPTTCPRGTQPLVSKTVVKASATKPSNATQTTIPRIVHLPVESYCARPAIQDWVQQWILSLQNAVGSGTGGSGTATTTTTLYVHDVPSQERLLRLASVKLESEFPQLSQLVRNNNACLGQQQGDDENAAAATMASSLLEELWKYMVLYLYGGLYANFHLVDYGLQPFPPSLPTDTADVIYFHEETDNDDSGGSTFVEPRILMASPGHPLLYLALQYTIHDIVSARPSSSSSSSVGSPMERALVAFTGMPLKDLLAVVRTPPLRTSTTTTTITGMHNRTVAIASRGTFFPEAGVVSSKTKAKQQQQQQQQQRHGVPPSTTPCREKIAAEIMGETAAAAARKR